MIRLLLAFTLFFSLSGTLFAQSCGFDAQITTVDSVLCAGDSALLNFNVVMGTPADTVLPNPIVNNNGQDGNMFNITASNAIRIRYFEGLIANTPNAVTEYYIYYKVGTHVGFENNPAAWTLLAGPINFAPNAPNALTTIPYDLNITIPAGQTYAFYLTNSSAITNNNRYHNGTATGNVSATNADLTVFEGTGGAYPFGTFFNARPWEGTVHYDYPPATYTWNTGETTSSLTVAPTTTTSYSCIASLGGGACFVEDTITVTVNALPVSNISSVIGICAGDTALFDAGNIGSTYAWSTGDTTQTLNIPSNMGAVSLMVTDSNGCVLQDTSTIIENALPTLSVTADTICAGETGTLTATSSDTLFTWSPGSFSGAVVNDSPAVTTTYTVTVQNFAACTTTVTTTLVVNVSEVANTNGDVICAGETGTLTATSGTGQFVWEPGSLSGSVVSDSPAITTDYTLTVTDSNGCVSMDTATIVVNDLPVVSMTSVGMVCVYDSPLALTQGTPAGGDYAGPGVAGNVLDPSTAGTGTHILVYTFVDGNGCSNFDSGTLDIDSCLAVDEFELNASIIYPNPFHETATLLIDTQENLHGILFVAYDMAGKEVMVIANPENHQLQIARGNLESGIYQFRLTNNERLIGYGKMVIE
ncbi:MAG: T9SS type A sorting domain-containing protein [Bacteroidota bacterium]